MLSLSSTGLISVVALTTSFLTKALSTALFVSFKAFFVLFSTPKPLSLALLFATAETTYYYYSFILVLLFIAAIVVVVLDISF